MAVDLVIDADGHCIEPLEGLAKWMPAEYADRVPVATKDAQG